MKKQLITIAIAAISLVACKNSNNKNAAKTADSTTASTGGQMGDMDMSKPTDPNAVVDPVCGMEKDNTWTDYTVYKGDTVWFCSSVDKDAFLGNPKKYEGNIHHH